jgi:hypothetical protein
MTYRISALLGLTLLLSSWLLHAASSGSSGRTPFGPLHIYYISPTGNDGHAGSSPNTAWATPNHSVVCGDVIIAEAGNYTGGWRSGQWGTVSRCPSTSGGIDGAGGVQFAVLLCAGPDLGSCHMDGQGAEAVRVDQSHWAVEGWVGTQNINANGGCFTGESDSKEQKYLAFINDIASTCDLTGFGTSGGGASRAGSFDYIAAVGIVSFNGANSISPYCGSGISLIPGNADLGTGTHIFVSGYFGAYNTNASGTGECASGNLNFPHSDGEGIIFDTYAAGYTTSGFNKRVVLENAVIWQSGGACVEIFPNGNGTSDDLAQYYVSNVTCYGNNQDPMAYCGGGELFLNQIYPTSSGSYTVTDSIFEATQATCGGADSGNTVYGALLVANTSQQQWAHAPVTLQRNYIWRSHPPTSNGVGPPNTHFIEIGAKYKRVIGLIRKWLKGVEYSWFYGTNTYGDPGLTRPISLFSTAPDCTSYTSVTDCVLTGYHVYNQVKPMIAPTTIGYQSPAACAPDAHYPTWLKGIVYLQWNGSSITENAGLINKPCGM